MFGLMFGFMRTEVYSLVFHSLGMGEYLSRRTATNTACVPDPLLLNLNTGSLIMKIEAQSAVAWQYNQYSVVDFETFAFLNSLKIGAGMCGVGGECKLALSFSHSLISYFLIEASRNHPVVYTPAG